MDDRAELARQARQIYAQIRGTEKVSDAVSVTSLLRFCLEAATALDKTVTLEAEVARLREALKPFAEIAPSSFYPEDGSEDEEYIVVLQDHYGNPPTFSGKDLARARAAFAEKEKG